MLIQQAHSMLDNTIIPFWQAQRDEQHGGFFGSMGFDLTVDRKAPKGGIHTSRILWFFSEAARQLNRPDLLEYADHAYEFLRGSLLDQEYGGVYWMATYDGAPLDTTKHTYCQAFAIYGLAAYYRAVNHPEALHLAGKLYELIEEKCWDGDGYGEAFSRDFAPAANDKLSENGVLAEKTMNTLLHVFEGYAGLYEAGADKAVESSMYRILSLYMQRVYNPALRRQEVFFDRNWNSLLDLTSYGHDIESSWLMDWGAGLLPDKQIAEQVSSINSNLADAVYEKAYREGSLINESEKGRDDKHRVWWVQAEALVGFLNQWQKYPDKVFFREAANQIWGYIQTYLVDQRERSEWFWRVDETGKPDTELPIIEPWKCPYHNGRMCLEIIRRFHNAAS